MSGTVEDWKKVMPVLNAFVNGEQIQSLDYDRRWKDTNRIYSILCSPDSYRIKPAGIHEGTWTISFSSKINGSVDGPIGSGVYTWKGSNADNPPWPTNDSSITLHHDTERWVADE